MKQAWFLVVGAALGCASLGCERSAAPLAADAHADAGPLAAPKTEPVSGRTSEVVVFPGAAGWTGGRGCTDVRPEDGCDSQWLHTSGQLARVFVVDVNEERALDAFVARLSKDVVQQGGLVDRFTQSGLTLVRFLQPVRSDEGKSLASINYTLVGRDRKAVHLITSVVDFEQQQPADGRLRGLLSFAAWAAR